MKLRNIAIIAHVDHGKTTLVDELLKQSGSFRDNQKVAERAMDSNDLERERGITILAKCTSVVWKDTRINIVDTPGHADFGGEVERILNMVDGVIVLVDASEGPLPQTKFVVSKALTPRTASDCCDQQDRPSGRTSPRRIERNLRSIRQPRRQRRAARFPGALRIGPQRLDGAGAGRVRRPIWRRCSISFWRTCHRRPLTTVLCACWRRRLRPMRFSGRILTGRITSGTIKPNMALKAIRHDGSLVETFRATKVLAYRGLERVPVDEASAGEIVALAGMTDATVADTLCDPSVDQPLTAQPIDPPTLSMTFRINDGPFAGQEGSKVQSRVIRDRLMREAERNIAIKVTDSDETDSFVVSGRGELATRHSD